MNIFDYMQKSDRSSGVGTIYRWDNIKPNLTTIQKIIAWRFAIQLKNATFIKKVKKSGKKKRFHVKKQRR